MISPPKEYMFNYNIKRPRCEVFVTIRLDCFHMGIKNLPHSHEVGIKNWWTISDLFYIHQRKHLHRVMLVNSYLCYQCTKWNSFAIHGNHVETCQGLRLDVILLLVYPNHMMIKWYHQMHLWMRYDCRVGIHLYHLQSSLQLRCWIFSKCRRCLDCRLLAAFLFQSYACVLWVKYSLMIPIKKPQ